RRSVNWRRKGSIRDCTGKSLCMRTDGLDHTGAVSVIGRLEDQRLVGTQNENEGQADVQLRITFCEALKGRIGIVDLERHGLVQAGGKRLIGFDQAAEVLAVRAPVGIEVDENRPAFFGGSGKGLVRMSVKDDGADLL